MVLRLAEPEDFELFCSLYNNLENEMLYSNEQNEVCLDNEFNFDDETLNEYSPTFNSKDEFLAILNSNAEFIYFVEDDNNVVGVVYFYIIKKSTAKVVSICLKDNSYIKQVFELLVNLKGIKEFHISPTSPAICSLLEKMPGVEKAFKFYYKAKKYQDNILVFFIKSFYLHIFQLYCH